MNGKLCELLGLLDADKPYGTIAAFANTIIESLTEIQGAADEYHRKLIRTGWQDYWDKDGSLTWGWFGDIEHDRTAKARYAVFTEMARFVRSATNQFLRQKYAQQLRDVCCEYLSLEGYEVAAFTKTSPPAAGETPRQPKKPKRKRWGRPVDTNLKQDADIATKWATGKYRTKAELNDALDLPVGTVHAAVERHRKRKSRRTN